MDNKENIRPFVSWPMLTSWNQEPIGLSSHSNWKDALNINSMRKISPNVQDESI